MGSFESVSVSSKKTPNSSMNNVSNRNNKESKANNDINEKYQMNEKLINEEFKIWKKTSPLLYDLIYTYASDSPALTVNWLDDYKLIDNNDESFIEANFFIGTHSKDSQNHIKLVSVNVPSTISTKEDSNIHNNSDNNRSNNTNKFIPGFSLKSRQLHIVKEWNHPGEVNKLRINQISGLIATQTNSGDILLYDINDSNISNHKSTLKFHNVEGFGLEWNPIFEKNQLLSSAEDGKIAFWDLDSKKLSESIKPKRIFDSHEGIVNDISWNKCLNDLFASVSDDGTYQIHDFRLSTGPIINIAEAHFDPDSDIRFNVPINSVEFHPDIPTLFATGGTDNCIQIWDMRNPTIPIRRLQGHRGAIMNLKWHNNYLLSTSVDHRVLIWDLNNLEEGEMDKKKADYIDPCLVFMHGGHTGKICEADWHPTLENLIVSCAEDGLLEVWKPAHLEAESEDDDEEDDNEEENKKGTKNGGIEMKN